MSATTRTRRHLGSPPGMKLVGTPWVYNGGQMHLGSDLFIASRPVVSHLITEPSGVLTIGRNVAIGYGAAIYCEREIRIGDGSQLSPFCVIADTDFHYIGSSRDRPEPRPIIIGRDVRIEARVNVLPGSQIGDGARILAGSTVAAVIPAGAVAGGVPAIDGNDQSPQTAGGPEERVRELVKGILGLKEAPGDHEQRQNIPQWNSLAALRIVLGVEGLFNISLTELELTEIHSIADLIAAVRRSRT